MKKHYLHLAILLTIICQLTHALGLCSVHVHNGIKETEFHAHPCDCSHDHDHQGTSDHGQRVPQPNHCGECCPVESHTVPPTRTMLQTIALNLYLAPTCLHYICPTNQVSHVSANVKLPKPVPLYLALCTLLI